MMITARMAMCCELLNLLETENLLENVRFSDEAEMYNSPKFEELPRILLEKTFDCNN